MNKRAGGSDGSPASLIAARDQVIPSMTAVIAAPRTATVAASTVTAAASQRSRRLGAIAACGGAAGIAGRISTGIVDTPWPGARRRLHYFGRFTHAAACCKSIFDNAGIVAAVVERKLREWCGARRAKLAEAGAR